MYEQAPPTPEETRPSERQAWKKDSKRGIQDIPLLFVNNNRMLGPISGHIYRSGENIHHLGSDHPSFPQCLIRLEAWPTTEPVEPESSTDRNLNRFTSSRRTACCRIWKAPVCPRWWDWAQDGALTGRGSPGWAWRLTPWSPATQKERLSQWEPAEVLHGSREQLGPGGGTMDLTAF